MLESRRGFFFLGNEQISEFKNFSVSYESFAAEVLGANPNIELDDLLNLILSQAYAQKKQEEIRIENERNK